MVGTEGLRTSMLCRIMWVYLYARHKDLITVKKTKQSGKCRMGEDKFEQCQVWWWCLLLLVPLTN
jgi:hypothetical protein